MCEICFHSELSKYNLSCSTLVERSWKFGEFLSLVWGVILGVDVILSVLRPRADADYVYGLV